MRFFDHCFDSLLRTAVVLALLAASASPALAGGERGRDGKVPSVPTGHTNQDGVPPTLSHTNQDEMEPSPPRPGPGDEIPSVPGPPTDARRGSGDNPDVGVTDDVISIGADPSFDGTLSSCPADATGDGAVDFLDLAAVLQSWGACAQCGSDLDHDGAVGVEDLLAVLLGWGACD